MAAFFCQVDRYGARHVRLCHARASISVAEKNYTRLRQADFVKLTDVSTASLFDHQISSGFIMDTSLTQGLRVMASDMTMYNRSVVNLFQVQASTAPVENGNGLKVGSGVPGVGHTVHDILLSINGAAWRAETGPTFEMTEVEVRKNMKYSEAEKEIGYVDPFSKEALDQIRFSIATTATGPEPIQDGFEGLREYYSDMLKAFDEGRMEIRFLNSEVTFSTAVLKGDGLFAAKVKYDGAQVSAWTREDAEAFIEKNMYLYTPEGSNYRRDTDVKTGRNASLMNFFYTPNHVQSVYLTWEPVEADKPAE